MLAISVLRMKDYSRSIVASQESIVYNEKPFYMGDYRTLLAYQKSFALAMRIHHLTKTIPTDDKVGLVAQF